jgi:hypothetical protein
MIVTAKQLDSVVVIFGIVRLVEVPLAYVPTVGTGVVVFGPVNQKRRFICADDALRVPVRLGSLAPRILYHHDSLILFVP